MPPVEATSGVSSLVASIKQHKKFKQLASYSVQCLCKVITPPHQGWERNLVDAFEAGALEAITEVLQRHSGDTDILKASTQCFAAMATNPHYAAALVDSGALMGMLESVMKNPDADEGVRETLALMEAIATHNPEALLMGGGADAAARVMGAATGRFHVVGACVRTLERLNKVPGGPAALVECDAVRAVVALVGGLDAGGSEEREGLVEAGLRLLDRTARVPEYADYLRNECSGMRVLSDCLALNRASDRICKVGGRLLSKLAASSVGELIAKLEDGATPPAEREFLAGLLANLALEEENAEKIVAHGGIPALLRCFGASTRRTVEAACLAIARLAANEDHADALVAAGAIGTLVEALRANVRDAALCAAIVPTLARLAELDAESVDAAGGVEAVLAALRAHAGHEALAGAALAFAEVLGPADFDMPRLVGLGAIDAIAAGMRAHRGSPDVQLAGTRALIYLSYCEPTAAAISAAGGLDICLANLDFEGNKELMLATLYLVTSLALLGPTKDALIRAGGVDKLLTAIAAFAGDEEMQETAAELLNAIIDEAAVGAMVAAFAKATEDALRTKGKPELSRLRAQAQRLVALSVQPDFAELIIRGTGVAAIVRCLESVAGAQGLPEVEPVLTACGDALNGLAIGVEESDELRSALGRTGAVRGVIAAIKAHPKLVKAVQSCVHFLESYAQDAALADAVIEAGAVEACVAALRANLTSVDVVTSATNTLLQLAMTDKCALDVARRGGTRQIISTVHANVATPGFATAIEQALALLMRVALLAEGADLLNKQGGVDAVIAASEAVAKMYEGAQAEAIKAAAAQVLARLLTLDDVARSCEELAELASSARRGRVPAADAMKPTILKLSHLAAVRAYAAAIIKRGGDKHLAEVIAALLGKDDAAVKAELLPIAFRVLANLSRAGRLSADVKFAPLIAAAIDGQFALAECLELIGNLAAASEATAAALLGDGRTLDMVIGTLKGNLRNPAVARLCFDALAALGGHPSTAPVVASSPALRLVSDWVDDNLDDASPEAVEAAVRTLGAMASSPEHAPGFLGGPMLELLKAVLTKACIESPAAAPSVLAASVRVVSALGAAGGPGAHNQLAYAGILRRVLRATATHRDGYLAAEPTVLQLLTLLRDFGVEEYTRTELLACGAQELIVSAMNAHGNSAAVLTAGAAALGALGAGEEAGRICIAEVQALAAALESAPEITEELVAALGAAVQRLGNFVLIDGVVTSGTAAAIMSVLSNAIALLAESELASAGTLAAGIQSIGRVVERGGAALEGSLQEAVEMVLDVVSMNDADVDIRMAAVHTLGIIANSPAGLRVVVDLGGLELINNSRRMAAGDRRLAAIVESTLERINQALQRNAAALLAAGDAAGTRALAALLSASVGDPARLAEILASFAGMAGGADALFDLMAHQRGNPELLGAMLGALSGQWGGAAGGEGNGRRVLGLTLGLQGALAAQAALGPHSDLRSKMNALRMAENTLGLLGGLDMRADGAAALFGNGGLEALLQLLAANMDDEETVKRVTGIVRGAMLFASPAAGRTMALPANMGTIVSVLRAWGANGPIAIDGVDIMSFTARTTGPAASGIDKEALRAVTAVATNPAHDGDVGMKSAITRLEGILGIRLYEADVSGRAFRGALTAARTALAALGALQECVTDDGRTYYFDPTTGVTTWEAPPAFAAFKAALGVLRETLARGDDPVPVLDADELGALVAAMTTQARSPAVAEAIAATLVGLAANDANANGIAAAGGIAAVMQIMQTQADNAAVVAPLLGLLERLSRNDAHKEAITSAGGIDALLNIAAAKHGTNNEEVALKILSTIANLAFNSTANIAALMAKGVVPHVLTLTRAWPKHARILENAMCALSNLMFGSDDNKRAIGAACAPEVVRVIAALAADVPLFKMALRALGNLSFCDDNIRPIVEAHHATRAIVAGMRANAKDAEVLQLAMDVIGNLASLEEAPPQVDEDGNVLNPKASIAELILKEAGCGEVISSLRRFPRSPALLESGLDALTNIANDPEVTEIMVRKQGLVGLVMEIIQNNSEFEPSVVAHALPLLAAITYSRELVPAVVAANGVQVMLSTMEQHGGNTDILLSAQLTLYHMAAQEEARTSLKNQEGLRTILALLEAHAGVKGYVEEVLKTLTRLCADDALSAAIAENGMHVLTAIMERHADDPELLTAAFRLLGHLAFVESNLTIIVQHNGIVRVMNAITAHPECQPLIVRSIQTLDNIAMANKENAQIVIDEGGKELIETIMSTYADDDEIQRYGRSALLSMSALENLSKSAEITRRAAASLKNKAPKPAEAAAVDPLAEFRHALSAGKIMKVWTKGVPKAEHVVVSTDWRSIVWQDVLSHKKQGALDLRAVVAVRAGAGEGHKKAFTTSKAADPACTFTIVGERMSLDVEAGNPKERQLWVDGLSKLLVVFRTTPHLL